MLQGWQDRINGALAKTLFFIAGTEKSGTTWLQLMLDAHPEAACRGEGQFLSQLVPNLEEALRKYAQYVGNLNSTVFKETSGFPLLGREHVLFIERTAIGLLLAEYGPLDGIKAIGEKTPATVRSLDALKELFPDARLVFMLRDGRDVAVSGWLHLRRQYGPERAWETIGQYTQRVAKVWRRDHERMRAFTEKYPDAGIEVRYERLSQDAAGELSRVLRFLGLASDPATVAACVRLAAFDAVSGGRAEGDENRDSHFRKGIVGDWRNYFDEEAVAAFEREAGPLLRSLGYGS